MQTSHGRLEPPDRSFARPIAFRADAAARGIAEGEALRGHKLNVHAHNQRPLLELQKPDCDDFGLVHWPHVIVELKLVVLVLLQRIRKPRSDPLRHHVLEALQRALGEA
eukprot:CAMPEP_0181331310 /NCGR_PEP_ID=MMETSP1101-20121128/24427_1 /TAXON_ID=46948 /ORGANISM="Rhodomonas abbreviata, Strain Caron Lab Isolate" /LENGTH=108 /DNA_ID=CAMNT_0023440749 /DNA_START=240 /DNA_END=566 /DNA_ORIENTATION=+